MRLRSASTRSSTRRSSCRSEKTATISSPGTSRSAGSTRGTSFARTAGSAFRLCRTLSTPGFPVTPSGDDSDTSCTHAAPEESAASSPCQGDGGSGARQRSGPVGGAAKGMPFHACVSFSPAKPTSAPWTSARRDEGSGSGSGSPPQPSPHIEPAFRSEFVALENSQGTASSDHLLRVVHQRLHAGTDHR